MSNPRISIGLPVYNGEDFLEETLNSLLSQSYRDFELIISDNASTDRTQEICEASAARDARIRYYRQGSNLGAAANYNLVFQESTGAYFKWAAHDDLYAPTFLERCAEVLETHPEVVLVFPLATFIEADGNVFRSFPSRGPVYDMNRLQRFCNMTLGSLPVVPVFGLMRREVLAETRLIGKYAASDRPLIGEIALRGKLFEVQENLFFYRLHPGQSWGSGRSRREQQAWYDPGRAGKRTYPSWRLLLEHERSIWRVPLSIGQRIVLQWAIVRWIRKSWRTLGEDLLVLPLR